MIHDNPGTRPGGLREAIKSAAHFAESVHGVLKWDCQKPVRNWAKSRPAQPAGKTTSTASIAFFHAVARVLLEFLKKGPQNSRNSTIGPQNSRNSNISVGIRARLEPQHDFIQKFEFSSSFLEPQAYFSRENRRWSNFSQLSSNDQISCQKPSKTKPKTLSVLPKTCQQPSKTKPKTKPKTNRCENSTVDFLSQRPATS